MEMHIVHRRRFQSTRACLQRWWRWMTAMALSLFVIDNHWRGGDLLLRRVVDADSAKACDHHRLWTGLPVAKYLCTLWPWLLIGSESKRSEVETFPFKSKKLLNELINKCSTVAAEAENWNWKYNFEILGNLAATWIGNFACNRYAKGIMIQSGVSVIGRELHWNCNCKMQLNYIQNTVQNSKSNLDITKKNWSLKGFLFISRWTSSWPLFIKQRPSGVLTSFSLLSLILELLLS